jgi:hypothetical protein
MAGSGWRTFTAGAVLTAAQIQNYLQDQAVQVYASAAARTAALGTAVATGMVSYRTDGTAVEYYNGSAWVALVDLTREQVLQNKTLLTPLETITVLATAATGTVNFDAATQAILYYTTNASANFTLNIRGSGSQTLDSYMQTGESVTVVFMNTNGATAYYPTAYQIDGVAKTPKWVSGVAPAAGNASAIDAYTLTIIKTGSAAFTLLASQIKYA